MRGERFVDALGHIADRERPIVLFAIGTGAVLSITGDLGGKIGFANAGVTDALGFELVEIFVLQRCLRSRKLRDARFAQGNDFGRDVREGCRIAERRRQGDGLDGPCQLLQKAIDRGIRVTRFEAGIGCQCQKVSAPQAVVLAIQLKGEAVMAKFGNTRVVTASYRVQRAH